MKVARGVVEDIYGKIADKEAAYQSGIDACKNSTVVIAEVHIAAAAKQLTSKNLQKVKNIVTKEENNLLKVGVGSSDIQCGVAKEMRRICKL